MCIVLIHHVPAQVEESEGEVSTMTMKGAGATVYKGQELSFLSLFIHVFVETAAAPIVYWSN